MGAAPLKGDGERQAHRQNGGGADKETKSCKPVRHAGCCAGTAPERLFPAWRLSERVNGLAAVAGNSEPAHGLARPFIAPPARPAQEQRSILAVSGDAEAPIDHVADGATGEVIAGFARLDEQGESARIALLDASAMAEKDCEIGAGEGVSGAAAGGQRPGFFTLGERKAGDRREGEGADADQGFDGCRYGRLLPDQRVQPC